MTSSGRIEPEDLECERARTATCPRALASDLARHDHPPRRGEGAASKLTRGRANSPLTGLGLPRFSEVVEPVL